MLDAPKMPQWDWEAQRGGTPPPPHAYPSPLPKPPPPGTATPLPSFVDLLRGIDEKWDWEAQWAAHNLDGPGRGDVSPRDRCEGHPVTYRVTLSLALYNMFGFAKLGAQGC